MKLWHIINGKAYLAPEGMDEAAYRIWVKQAYGTLKGVKFVWASDRMSALHESVKN